MTSQFYNFRFRRILIFSFFLFFTFDGYTQVEFLGDFNTRENGSNPAFFKRYQDKILFFANQSIYSIDTLGGNLSLVADSVKFVNEELTPDPFVIHGGFIFYISNNNLWKTNLIQFTNLGIYNAPIHSFFFAGDMPIVIGNYGAYTPFNEQAASIPFQNNGYLIPIGGLNFFYLPFFEIYRDFIPQRVGNKLYCFVSLTNNSVINISSVRENSIGTSYLGKVDSLDSFVMSNYQQLNDFKSNLFKPVVTINNIVYFVVSKSVTFSTSRNELWKIDNDVLSKVSDFNPSNTSNQSGLTHRLYNLNGKIVILLSSNGVQELWVSDGTTGNISLLKTFKTNVLLDDTFATILHGRLFFSAAESDDFELWETDGTVGNTKLFKDLDLTKSSSPSRFIRTKNGFAFQTNDGSIWMSEGTSVSTIRLPFNIQDLRINQLVQNKFLQVGKFIFGSFDNSSVGAEPFRFDTETLELTNLANLNIITESFGYDLGLRFKLGDRWFFNGVKDGKRGLFSTDGTLSGTYRNSPASLDMFPIDLVKVPAGMFVKEHFQETRSNGLGFLDLDNKDYTRLDLSLNETQAIDPSKLFSLNDKAIFFDQNAKQKLYATDGLNKPILIKEFDFSIESIYSTNTLVFCSSNGLWTYDGLEFSQLTNSADFNLPLKVNNYFSSEGNTFLFAQFKNSNSEVKFGLFHSDGTRAGTNLLYTFEGFSSIQDFSYFDSANSMFFAFKTGTVSRVFEFMKAGNSVRFLASLQNVVQDGFSSFLVFNKLENYLYLQYNDGNSGFVSKINLSNLTFTIVNEGRQNFKYEIEEVKGVLYFRSIGSDYTSKIIRTDGTGIGTYVLPTPYNNNVSFIPRLFMPFPDKLVFFSEVQTFGAELLKYTPRLCENSINQSVKSGRWMDSDTWSCGSVPDETEDVIINKLHKVVLESNDKGAAKSLNTISGTILDLQKGSILEIRPN